MSIAGEIRNEIAKLRVEVAQLRTEVEQLKRDAQPGAKKAAAKKTAEPEPNKAAVDIEF